MNAGDHMDDQLDEEGTGFTVPPRPPSSHRIDPLVSPPTGAPVENMAPPPIAPSVSGQPDSDESESPRRRPGLLVAAGAAALVAVVVLSQALGGDPDPAAVSVVDVAESVASRPPAPSDVPPETGAAAPDATAAADVTETSEPETSDPDEDATETDDPPTSEPDATDAPADEAADGDDTDAVDVASTRDDPDVVALSIPMRDITDPDRGATGIIDLQFNTATGEVCYGVTSSGIGGPYASHIHAGDFGVKGGIVVELGQLESGDTRCVENLPVDTNAILANPAGHYAEFHDPSEEWTIRGQLSERIEGEIVSIVVPMEDAKAINPDAEGVIEFDFNTVTGEICYAVTSSGVEGPYSSHIHAGVVGVKGGIVVKLGKLDDGDQACVDNLPVDTNAILADPAGHYAELHDVGEVWTVRGQLSDTIAGLPDEGVSEDGEGDGETADEAPAPATVDPDGGGARIELARGTIYLRGDVADQQTADELIATLSGVADIPVVDELAVVADAPLPSGRVVIADAFFFATDSARIRQPDGPTLDAIVALAESRPDWVLTVVGHTDDRGSDVDNLELSLRRATAVRDLLAERGLPDQNLRIRGAGETAPIRDNSNPDGQAQNRRIEFEFAPS